MTSLIVFALSLCFLTVLTFSIIILMLNRRILSDLDCLEEETKESLRFFRKDLDRVYPSLHDLQEETKPLVRDYPGIIERLQILENKWKEDSCKKGQK